MNNTRKQKGIKKIAEIMANAGKTTKERSSAASRSTYLQQSSLLTRDRFCCCPLASLLADALGRLNSQGGQP